ncbi:MAG: glycine cleavage system aminomethyltransferase GcvT [Pseudomonadales bacterium]|nr:glycine cleavage system aminomethyltransferase GcvT [Pseudomonadales bacterium]
MTQHTPLHEQHLSLHARMVDFAGWDMPVQYTSVLDEHHAVRRSAGVFDVSHMTFLEVSGAQAKDYLCHLLANDVQSMVRPGQALYSAMLNEQGGILDDLIVYAPCEHQPDCWRVIVNCATHDQDIAWMQQQAAGYDLVITERKDLVMLAVQGPLALEKLGPLLNPPMLAGLRTLQPFQGIEVDGWFIARTGYTGEDGVEVLLPAERAGDFFRRLIEAGVTPCGLAARDTLRLEAGMNLYGSDMTVHNSPLTSNMAWTVRWDHDFVGKQALLAERDRGVQEALVGLVLRDRGVLRAHMKVELPDGRQGEITSGTFAPSLQHAIALARLPLPLPATVAIDIRGRRVQAQIVKPPFVRHGKACF